MLKTVLARFRQGHRTIESLEKKPPVLPDRFRGSPIIDVSKCPGNCRACEVACPTEAITITSDRAQIDLGRCIFCTDCAEACSIDIIRYSREYRMAASNREDLVTDTGAIHFTAPPKNKTQRLLRKSLKLRQVSAGGCNGCELDVNVLNTIVFDLVRFGIQFVASPRHADGLLVTGPVTQNMEQALMKTYEAVPAPKIVIAVGACAISGGPYINHGKVRNGVASVLPVDIYIPGCPPHPLTTLDGLIKQQG